MPGASGITGTLNVLNAWPDGCTLFVDAHAVSSMGGAQEVPSARHQDGNGEQLRAAILTMNLNTVYGGFKVDGAGLQIAHTMLTFQWQDGKKVIVWPDELAPGKPRFPTPPWGQRP